MHISIAPDSILHFYGLSITNTLLAGIIVTTLFAVLSISFYLQRNNPKSYLRFVILFLASGLYSLFEPVLHDKTKKHFPFLGALFAFILLNNWFGLLPGVGSVVLHEGEHAVPILKAATADLNTTIDLGLITMILVQFYGIAELGVLGYLGKFISFKSPIDFFIGILELVSELSKVLSFAFRLFGNIFAGEVLLVVISFLIPVLASFPFLVMEVFVGMVQALVFPLLAAVFIGAATTKHAH